MDVDGKELLGAVTPIADDEDEDYVKTDSIASSECGDRRGPNDGDSPVKATSSSGTSSASSEQADESDDSSNIPPPLPPQGEVTGFDIDPKLIYQHRIGTLHIVKNEGNDAPRMRCGVSAGLRRAAGAPERLSLLCERCFAGTRCNLPPAPAGQ